MAIRLEYNVHSDVHFLLYEGQIKYKTNLIVTPSFILDLSFVYYSIKEYFCLAKLFLFMNFCFIYLALEQS